MKPCITIVCLCCHQRLLDRHQLPARIYTYRQWMDDELIIHELLLGWDIIL